MTNHSDLQARALRLFAIPLVFGVTIVGATASSRPQPPTTTNVLCPTATPAANVTIANFKRALAASGSNGSSLRTNLGFIGVDSSSVVTVTDSLVCTRVTRVLDSVFNDTSPISYFVLRAGPRFIAFPHLQAVHSLFFLDTTYTFIGLTPY
jgi:hypothetical protein